MKLNRFRAAALRAVATVALSVFSSVATAEEPEQIFQVADTSSPRDTLESFIEACSEIQALLLEHNFVDEEKPAFAMLIEKALDCIDVSEIPGFARDDRASEAGVCIKEILDRIELPPKHEIPDREAIEKLGGSDNLTRWRIPGSRITIARVEKGVNKHQYLFSPGTVARASSYMKQIYGLPYRENDPLVTPGFYETFVSLPGTPRMAKFVQLLPESIQTGRVFGIAKWKLLGLGIVCCLGMALMVATYWLQIVLTNRVRGRSVVKHILTIAFPIFAMFVPLMIKHFVEGNLSVRGNWLYVVSFVFDAIALVAMIVVFAGISNRIAESIIASPRINPIGLNAQLVRIVSKLCSIAAALIVFIMGGQYLGIPIGTLLTSAGIFGAAIALSAQGLLKSLFGTVSLLLDKPFRVGERVVIGHYDGFVEDIGLRSTRLRLLNDHLVTLPNDDLAVNTIENVSSRTNIRKKGSITVEFDTPQEKLDKAVAIIREKLQDHEGMQEDYPPRVYFDEFAPEGFEILYIYWYAPPDYWKFKEFNERLNLEISQAFDREGIKFARVLGEALESRKG